MYGLFKVSFLLVCLLLVPVQCLFILVLNKPQCDWVTLWFYNVIEYTCIEFVIDYTGIEHTSSVLLQCDCIYWYWICATTMWLNLWLDIPVLNIPVQCYYNVIEYTGIEFVQLQICASSSVLVLNILRIFCATSSLWLLLQLSPNLCIDASENIVHIELHSWMYNCYGGTIDILCMFITPLPINCYGIYTIIVRISFMSVFILSMLTVFPVSMLTVYMRIHLPVSLAVSMLTVGYYISVLDIIYNSFYYISVYWSIFVCLCIEES